jgi:hypothetical protein
MKSINQEKLKNSIAGGLFMTLVMMVVFWMIKLDYFFVTALSSGVLFSISAYLFSNNKIIDEQTKLVDVDQSEIILSGLANHFINGEAAGGKLYLTKEKLIFKSHRLNLQNHELTIELKSVKKVERCRTLGLVPNGLKIFTEDETERFVVGLKADWKSKIEKLLPFR